MSDLEFSQRKTIEIRWDTEIIKGSNASIRADDSEVRNVDNDGAATVTFPQDFTGDSYITVEGSVSGEQEGVVTVV